MKLNKDPKVITLDFNNFVPRGSIIRSAGW